jgi:two-component system, response regulator PdtaR
MTERRPVVLVVEDEPLILIHSHLALEDAGYLPIAVADAGAALDALRERGDVEIMFTDVRLPGGIDGLALARRVRNAYPHVAIVVTSGSQRVEPEMLPPGAAFVAKPYTAAQITRMLERAIAA